MAGGEGAGILGFEPGTPPLIDGELASLDGGPIDLITWLCERVSGTCEDGAFVDLDLELRADGLQVPLGRFAEDIRDEHRIRNKRTRRPGEDVLDANG